MPLELAHVRKPEGSACLPLRKCCCCCCCRLGWHTTGCCWVGLEKMVEAKNRLAGGGGGAAQRNLELSLPYTDKKIKHKTHNLEDCIFQNSRWIILTKLGISILQFQSKL